MPNLTVKDADEQPFIAAISEKPPESEHLIPDNGPLDAARAASNVARARRGTLRSQRKWLPFHSNRRGEKGLHNPAAFHYNTITAFASSVRRS